MPMRISRTTVILLLANLVAFGLVWQATSGDQPAPANQARFFPPDPVRITLTDGPERLTLEKRGGWRMVEPFDWPANIWTVQRLVDELRFVGAETGFDVAEAQANGTALKDYGLATPRWTVRVATAAGTTIEARIGVQPATRNHFLLTEDGRRIIPVPAALAAALVTKADGYRADRIFEIADFEARAVAVRHFAKDAESVTTLLSEARPRIGSREQVARWRFTTPYDAPADAEAAPRAVAALADLRVTRFAPLPEAVTGLGTPVLRISLEGGTRRQVLLVGRPDPEKPDQLCAKLEDNPSVFLVEARALRDWLNVRETLADTRPADFDPALVTGFTIAAGGRSLTLHRIDGTGAGARWEITVAPGSTATRRRDAEAPKIGRFLDALARLQAVRRPAPVPGGATLPAVRALTNPGTSTLQTVELEFGADRILLSFSDDPDKGAGTRVVHAKGSPLAAVCDVSLLDGGHLEVEPKAWRNRTIAGLPPGARVSGLRLTDRADGKILGEARLGPDGKWAGTGRLDPVSASRLAGGLAEVRAVEFPGRDVGAGGWRYELRVTDQAATGGGATSENIRTYLCSRPLTSRALLMRDEADDDDFILAAGLAEQLVPLLAETGR